MVFTILQNDSLKQSAMDYQNYISTTDFNSSFLLKTLNRCRVFSLTSKAVPWCYCPVEKRGLSNCCTTFGKAKLISIPPSYGEFSEPFFANISNDNGDCKQSRKESKACVSCSFVHFYFLCSCLTTMTCENS